MMRILFAIVLCFVFGSQAFAATSITISESQTLTFPTIGLTGSGTTSLSVSPLNSSTSGNGQIIAGAASRGTYPLSAEGDGGVSISIDISGVTTGNPALTLSDFKGFYNGQVIENFPSPTLPLPAAHPASTPLYIGATVAAGAGVPTGTHQGSFTITVFVQ